VLVIGGAIEGFSFGDMGKLFANHFIVNPQRTVHRMKK
jgi:hypothetical protein